MPKKASIRFVGEHGAVWPPFLMDSLARWKQVEIWLESLLEKGNVWFAPLRDIAAQVNKQHSADPGSIRVDDWPYYDGPILTKPDS